jgi:hypothetical protein
MCGLADNAIKFLMRFGLESANALSTLTKKKIDMTITQIYSRTWKDRQWITCMPCVSGSRTTG